LAKVLHGNVCNVVRFRFLSHAKHGILSIFFGYRLFR
jgi:hypothetical protein